MFVPDASQAAWCINCCAVIMPVDRQFREIQEATDEPALVRRKFITAAVGAVVLVGFNTRTRSWVTRAQAATEVVRDGAATGRRVISWIKGFREASAVDYGHMFHRPRSGAQTSDGSGCCQNGAVCQRALAKSCSQRPWTSATDSRRRSGGVVMAPGPSTIGNRRPAPLAWTFRPARSGGTLRMPRWLKT